MMYRSMMQVYVKDSESALQFYKKAFCGEILCEYKHENGGYMHAELNAYGQVIAISEYPDEVRQGNTMQFCFHLGEGRENDVLEIYNVLKDGADEDISIGECSFSTCMFSLVDKYGVYWCVFV